MNKQSNSGWKNQIDTFIAAVVGAILVQMYMQHGGIGVSPDSIHYLSAAETLVKGGAYYQFDNQPLIMFPFGYPSFLAICKLILGKKILVYMPWMNGALFALLIFLSGYILTLSNTSKWLKWILLSLIVTSPTLHEIYFMLWSESLFAVEVLLFVIAAKKYFEQHKIKNLILFAIVTAIGFETRFAGVSLVATGGVLILLSHELNWSTRIKHAFMYGLLGCSLVIVNLIRNYTLTQTLTGVRQKGLVGLFENISHYGAVVVTWLPFSRLLDRFELIVGILFIVVVLSIFIYRIFKKIEHNSYEKIAATFTLMYSIFMLVTATISRYETINSRLLSPFFIACLFTVSFYAESLLAIIKETRIKNVTRFFIVTFSILILVQFIQRDVQVYNEVSPGGIGGYTEDDWKESELIKSLKENPQYFSSSFPVYSNASHAIYLYTKKAVAIVPERVHLDKVGAFKKQSAFLLFWFTAEDNKDVLSFKEATSNRNVKMIGSFKDGAIYYCTFADSRSPH